MACKVIIEGPPDETQYSEKNEEVSTSLNMLAAGMRRWLYRLKDARLPNIILNVVA